MKKNARAGMDQVNIGFISIKKNIESIFSYIKSTLGK